MPASVAAQLPAPSAARPRGAEPGAAFRSIASSLWSAPGDAVERRDELDQSAACGRTSASAGFSGAGGAREGCAQRARRRGDPRSEGAPDEDRGHARRSESHRRRAGSSRASAVPDRRGISHRASQRRVRHAGGISPHAVRAVLSSGASAARVRGAPQDRRRTKRQRRRDHRSRSSRNKASASGGARDA